MFKSLPDSAYVDLGLPSRTLWADRNVGAESVREFGCAFAKESLDNISPRSYSPLLASKGSEMLPSQQVRFSQLSFGDFGQDLWNLPTVAQAEELLRLCRWVLCRNSNGIYSYKVESTVNGNSILLPLKGYYAGSLTGKFVTFDRSKYLGECFEGRFWLKDCGFSTHFTPLGWSCSSYALCLNAGRRAARPVNPEYLLPVRPVRIGQQPAETVRNVYPGLRFNDATGEFEFI